MWELLGSFSQTPILLLGRKEQNRINKRAAAQRNTHLEGCSSHVNNNGTRKKRNYHPKSKKKNQRSQIQTVNQVYISRSANTHFRRAAHSNENNEPARFKEHACTTGRRTRRSRLNRYGRVRFDGNRRAGLRNTNPDAAADPQNDGKRV